MKQPSEDIKWIITCISYITTLTISCKRKTVVVVQRILAVCSEIGLLSVLKFIVWNILTSSTLSTKCCSYVCPRSEISEAIIHPRSCRLITSEYGIEVLCRVCNSVAQKYTEQLLKYHGTSFIVHRTTALRAMRTHVNGNKFLPLRRTHANGLTITLRSRQARRRRWCEYTSRVVPKEYFRN